ncbi:aminotransferase class V-fold PLP-dependent enzyme [Aureitalea marina]|uniref:Aminotransferase class V domain-containing protein n=1 Tax=Aureitalea marina TaxID=930804 RepID=A0A2S7KR16_9FLAO|nr:aminotransferase class V-fold PLP-dependent enzyme [Aureitalea marina]PQB05069.1 hypothetical protein BST85_09300 [Aureitalea marina]
MPSLPQNICDQFPATQGRTYLNTASCGLMPSSVGNWRREHDQRLLQEGSLYRDLHKPHIAQIRETVADFVGAEDMRVALVPNFSSGWNIVLDGLYKNSKVIYLKHDYPSIRWPLHERHFELIEVDGGFEPELALEQAVMEHKPDVLVLGLVHYVTGLRIDPDFLPRLKAYHPELLILADGTQFLGTTDFHFDNSGIDVLGGSAYKWLLGGYGCGFYAISRDVEERIQPPTIGYNSADLTQGSREGIPLIGRLEPGHQDPLTLGSMQLSMSWLQQLGMEAVEDYLQDLCGKAKAEFLERGWVEAELMERQALSTIFNLNLGEDHFSRLKQANVISSLRGQGIRVSFHLYNDENDLDKLIQVLA